jgi:crotonobetainyl-CoA:carnitine CoA-transferase CaiB-like acyl-CoA transferase
MTAMSGLLDGMRVVDASIWRPMPYATQLLCDLGADVLKIEPPGGDPMRGFPEIFSTVAAGKRSVMLDLKSDHGHARALDLIRDADVFCEGWRPGVAARLRLGYDHVVEVNPSVIYCSLSGYGQDGPLRDAPGHDANYQAVGGALARTLSTPTLPVGDLGGGIVAALCIAAAWARKLRTGEGEYIDVGMTDLVANWVGPFGSTAVEGTRVSGWPGYGVFRAADGKHLVLGVLAEDHLWRAVCDGLGLDDLRDVAYADRLMQREDLNATIADAISKLSGDDALARLTATGAPVSPVLTPLEMGAHPQLRERGVVVEQADGARRVGFPAVLRHHPKRPPGPLPPFPTPD